MRPCPYTGFYVDADLLETTTKEFIDDRPIKDILQDSVLSRVQDIMQAEYEQNLSKEEFLNDDITEYTEDGEII